MVSTNSHRIFNIKEMVKGLGVDVCRALSWFHAFTGCDIVSSFYGKGKVKAWDLWMSSSYKKELDKLFIKLGDLPKEITDPDFQLVQRFILDLYKKDITETLSTVRLKMFAFSTTDDLRQLPPSEDALLLHMKRASLQAGYLWKEAEEDVTIPDPKLWGWCLDQNNLLMPQWQLQNCSISIDQLTATCSCRSKTRLCKNCKCAKENLICLPFCNCMGNCKNNEKLTSSGT